MRRENFAWLGDPDARAQDTLEAFIKDEMERNPDLSLAEARQRVLDSVPELRAVIKHDQDSDNDAGSENSPHEGAHDSMDRRRLEATVLEYKKNHPGLTDRQARQAVHRANPQWRHLYGHRP